MNGVSPVWLKTIQELSPRILFGLCVLCLLILLLPLPIAHWLGIDSIRSHYRGWIGIIALAAFAFGLVQLQPWFWVMYHSRKRQKEIIEALNSLSEGEFIIMAYCFTRDRPGIRLSLNHIAALSLCRRGLLVPESTVGNPDRWPYIIPPYVWKHLPKLGPKITPDIKHRIDDFEKSIRPVRVL